MDQVFEQKAPLTWPVDAQSTFHYAQQFSDDHFQGMLTSEFGSRLKIFPIEAIGKYLI